MPIKELQFSFSISVEDLARALAQSNTGMRVQVLGTEPSALEERAETTAALPPPSRGVRHVLLTHMKKDLTRTYSIRELVVFCANFGFQTQSIYNAVHNMHTAGLVRRFGKGQYRLSKAGVAHE